MSTSLKGSLGVHGLGVPGPWHVQDQIVPKEGSRGGRVLEGMIRLI